MPCIDGTRGPEESIATMTSNFGIGAINADRSEDS